jgi:hypothetical protein
MLDCMCDLWVIMMIIMSDYEFMVLIKFSPLDSAFEANLEGSNWY